MLTEDIISKKIEVKMNSRESAITFSQVSSVIAPQVQHFSV